MNSIGDRLREERERLALTQDDFGAVGGVKRNAQKNYENSSRYPDAAYLEAVAKIGVDVHYVLTGDRFQQTSVHPSKEYLKDFSDTLFEVQEVMKNQTRDKIFDAAYSMHLKILSKLEARKYVPSQLKKAAGRN